MHLVVAARRGLSVTGDGVTALTLSLLEPTVQMLFFYLHETLWERQAQRRPVGRRARVRCGGGRLPIAGLRPPQRAAAQRLNPREPTMPTSTWTRFAQWLVQRLAGLAPCHGYKKRTALDESGFSVQKNRKALQIQRNLLIKNPAHQGVQGGWARGRRRLKSSVILAVLITSRHLLISLFRNTTDSLGDRPEGSTPTASSLVFTSSWGRIWRSRGTGGR